VIPIAEFLVNFEQNGFPVTGVLDMYLSLVDRPACNVMGTARLLNYLSPLLFSLTVPKCDTRRTTCVCLLSTSALVASTNICQINQLWEHSLTVIIMFVAHVNLYLKHLYL